MREARRPTTAQGLRRRIQASDSEGLAEELKGIALFLPIEFYSLQHNSNSVLDHNLNCPFQLGRALEKPTPPARHIECLVRFFKSPQFRSALQYSKFRLPQGWLVV